MSEIVTGDEVMVFNQLATVEAINPGEPTMVKLRGPYFWGFFKLDLLTKIEPPPPWPQTGEVWEHVDGKGRLFFYDGPEDLWCIAPNGDACAWKYVQDKHFYSKVETSG